MAGSRGARRPPREAYTLARTRRRTPCLHVSGNVNGPRNRRRRHIQEGTTTDITRLLMVLRLLTIDIDKFQFISENIIGVFQKGTSPSNT